MPRPPRRPVPFLIILLAALSAAPARAAAPRFGTYIAADGLSGGLVLAGPGDVSPELVEVFFDRAGGGPLAVIRFGDGDDALPHPRFARRVTQPPALVRNRADADAESWRTALEGLRGVWLDGADAGTVATLAGDTALHRALERLLARGGTIGAAGAAASASGAVLPSSGRPGLGLLPGTIVAADGALRESVQRLRATVDANPDHFGIAIDRMTALVTSGRRGAVVGRSSVVVTLAGANHRAARIDRLLAGTVTDLVTLSRAAVARAGATFPPARPGIPAASRGTLIIGGGGNLTRDVVRLFIAAAGGPTAPIVVIPTALGPRSNQGASDVQYLRAARARNVTIVHASRAETAEQPSVLDPLRRARGIWFSGGRQWRIVDSYLGTPAARLMHGVLARGGVIGGSSAGASIQAEYMVRGHPLDNRIVMAEGYERGLGFLPGTAIDQHFSERGRAPDMAQLKGAYPQLLGIGIDESTTAIVRGSVLEVSGANRIFIYDGGPGAAPTRRTVLRAGDRYDLARRRRLPPRRR